LPTTVEVIQAALGGGDRASAAIKLLEDHRRSLARSFLTSARPEQDLSGRIPEIAALAASGFPWDPAPEDHDLAQTILERWRQAETPEPNVVMAAMALAPAHHFPAPPRLALLPQWLRPTYVRYLLARAPLFLHPGEADRYAAHGIQAMAAVHAAIFEDRAPGADELAGVAGSADSTLTYFSGQSLKAYFRDKARMAEWAMLRQGHQLGFGFPLPANAKPRIGVLHRTLAPGTETYHLLAHLEGRDRSAAEVWIYMLDAAPNAMTDAVRPWVDGFVQLPADIPGAVARLRADGLDVCFVTNNLGWGMTRETAIASHRVARVQVVSGACPATPGISTSDLFLSSQGNDPLANAQDDYVERLVFLSGAVGRFGYAHDIDPPTLTCTRRALGVSDEDVFFFSGANYYKIEPEILETWAEILARTPRSSLGLMPFNPNWGGNYPLALFMRRLNRQLVRSGVAPSRVRLIGQVPTRADLLAIIGLADVYLDSFPYSGACSLVDPLMVGLPIVGRAGTRLRTAQGGSLLRAEGLDGAVCADAETYIERAVRLAQDPAYRKDEADRVRRASSAGLACIDTRPFARRFSAFCVDAARAAHERIAAQRQSSPKALRRDVAHAAAAALAEAAPALLRLHDIELARQLLAPWLQTLAAEGLAAGRVFDVGACAGTASAPFLAAGFRVEMFEPDPERAGGLGELVTRHPGLAAHWPTAVVAEPATDVAFNKRSMGLSGLGDSPHGEGTVIRVPATTLAEHLRDHPGEVDLIKIDAEGSDFEILRGLDLAASGPKAIMVEFGVDFPGQSATTIAGEVAGMEKHGYGACVFEYRRLEGLGASNWEHELVDVALDAKKLGTRGDGFGNIVFYRREDTIFLTCLAQLLEGYGPAPTRPAFVGLGARVATGAAAVERIA
jgi:FkbM family methyltransferase